MASIKVGDKIKNMVCILDKTPSGRVRLQCNICGCIGDYDRYSVVTSKQPCRVCRHFGKYTFDHIEDGKNIEGYTENNNKVIRWAFQKENEDIMKLPLNTVVFKCKDCGNIFGASLTELRGWGEVKCPTCKNKPNIVNKTKIMAGSDRKIRAKIDADKKLESKNDIEKTKNLSDDTASYFGKNLMIEDKKDELVGKVFGTLEIISVILLKKGSSISSTNRVKCRCKICGMEEEYDKFKVTHTQTTCKMCKKMETKLYKGKNEKIRDMVGTVVNGLKITAQKQNENGTWIGEYTCLNCKTKGKAALVKLSTKDVYCKKCMEGSGVKPMQIYCDECGNKINVPYRILYGTKVAGRQSFAICPRCKHKVDFKIESALLDDQSTFRNVLNSYTKLGLGLSDIDTDSRLAKFGDVFINRKGERCYNCYCIEHRQELVLSESEIDEFNHKQCNCEDVNFYKLLNIPTKVKRTEKSVDDILESKE